MHRIPGVAGLTITCAVAVTLLLGGASQADPRDDKNRVDAQLAQTQATLEAATDRARQAASDHAAATAALPGAETTLADARGRALGAEAAARAADREAAQARAAAAEATRAYDESAARVEQAREQVSEFVTAAYKGGGFILVNSILEAGSATEFANRVGYLDSVAQDQQRALNDLTAARLTAKQQSDTADAARQRADATAEAARGALHSALAAQASAEQAARTLRELAERQASALAVAEQERAATLARYHELKAQGDRIAAELRAIAEREAREARARARGNANGNRSGGNRSGGDTPGPVAAPPRGSGAFFVTPVTGWKSSDFGNRYDPYYRVWQLHAGIDLAAGGGQPIRAAAAGRVIKTGWYGGYGNYTCLSHGEHEGQGLATCYAHQSQVLVSMGQSVGRGQVIGRVGTTGASTGYHLHFEVRRDGAPVNPIGWLPACLC